MPRNQILAEMRRSGVARPVIQDLASHSGAYIIVSGAASTSDRALANRRKAMTEAVADIAASDRLTLDYYDSSRLATWVRDHPGFIPWVRKRIGKALSGWRSYGAWAYAPTENDTAYLIDDAVRLQTGKRESVGGLPAADGLDIIRDLLRESGKIVRLIGLSGVGKTRFVQALFEPQVGMRPLDPSLAIYADVAGGAAPQPMDLATNLIALRQRAILVLDNCPQDLHQRLSELCRAAGSTLSVITVEYDIRDDEPEGTEVFLLEPSSIELVEKLVKQRFSGLSSIDVGTAAEFSGGNARIALALAATVGRHETLAGLTDDGLFRRLFHQRHQDDQTLLRAAQACALVYSFDGEAITGGNAELPRLGSLVGMTGQAVFASVADLRARNLIQQRSKWRSVLPHAVANRLAVMALQNIPYEVIEAQLVHGTPERLLQSFSRRLGYLHASPEAAAIVAGWLAPEGLLADVANLNALGRAIFNNIAPVSLESTLDAIERAVEKENGSLGSDTRKDFTRLLRSLAFEAGSFQRTVNLLALIAKSESKEAEYSEAGDTFASLFYLYLSGTHASLEQRLAFTEKLLTSNEVAEQELGCRALDAMLEAWHFSSSYNFEFGSRPRDHGYWPQTDDEVRNWYGSALELAARLARAHSPTARRIRDIIADNLRGLWTHTGLFDVCEDIAAAVVAEGFWREGWVAIRQIQKFDSKNMPDEILERLSALERRLRPANLRERVRTVVLGRRGHLFDFDDFDDDDGEASSGIDRADAVARQLGLELARDHASFDELLPDLVSGHGRLWWCGRGLAEGSPDQIMLWGTVVQELAKAPRVNQNVQILRGILNGIAVKSPEIPDALLEEALRHNDLSRHFPLLQSALPVDARSLARLRRSLESGLVPVQQFEVLGWLHVTDDVEPRDMTELILAVADQDGGYDIAADALSMRLHGDRRGRVDSAPELLNAGREILKRFNVNKRGHEGDHRLGQIARACLIGVEGASVARGLLTRIRDAVARHEIQAFHHEYLIEGIFKVQPSAAMDGLFDSDKLKRKDGVRVLENLMHMRGNPLNGVPDDVVICWCEEDPAWRYPVAAAVVDLFQRPNEKDPLRWTSLAYSILTQAPDRIRILGQFTRRFRPQQWSGSRAAIMESNLQMLTQLDLNDAEDLLAFVAKERERLGLEITEEREREARWEKKRDERFE